MNVIAPGVLVFALAFFTFLFRREACPDRRRHWRRQIIAISGLLLIAVIGRGVVFGARSGDCVLELMPSVSARSK
jgi:hypothetical protein